MKRIDDALNQITMYRLVLWGLRFIAFVAVLLAVLGVLQFDAAGMIASLLLVVCSAYAANWLFSRLYGAPTNTDSLIITALIIFCIYSPPRTVVQGLILVVIVFMAMASKYLLAFHERHIFNPAMVAALVAGTLGLWHASWWIATDVMLPVVALVGLLVVRKIRRFPMTLSFVGVAFGVILIAGLLAGTPLLNIVQEAAYSWPLAFIAGIILIEPLTMPPSRRKQIMYGALVGLLLTAGLWLPRVDVTPELAVVLGNLFAYATLLRKRLPLRLVAQQELGGGVRQFNFVSEYPFTFTPGQYVDVTLPHSHVDARGNRRSLSIASSPTESDVKFGIKFYSPSSSFKAALANLQPGQYLYANQLAGDFVLPHDPTKKLLFIAGGIGITPFRSMLQYLVDTKQTRDIVLIYAASDHKQLVFTDVLQHAASYGLRVVYVLSSTNPQAIPAGWQGETGTVTAKLIAKTVPDFAQRLSYLSGPNGMVISSKALLKAAGVKGSQNKN